MSYTISKKTVLDKDMEEDGYEAIYHIDFTFQKQKSNVTVEIYKGNPNFVRLESNTDGYHWLQFFLSQDINTKKLLELDFKSQIERCQALFAPFSIKYEQECKESAWLTYSLTYDEAEIIKIIAEVIEPRFANRERFFEKK